MKTVKFAAAKAAAFAVVAGAVMFGLAGPAQANSGAMYGDPAAAAKYWRYQQYWDDCVLMSSADVVGQVTGQEPSEEQIIDRAHATPSSQGPGPIYTRPPDPKDPNSGQGAWFRDIPALLGQYNVGAVITRGSIEEVEQQLGAGHKVIASVNGELIWHKPVEEKDKNGNPSHDHSVVVTGVDTGTDVVHLNDSGSRKGRDMQIPMALFIQAWDASGELMAVTT
jgi:Peptidase_C39 like family